MPLSYCQSSAPPCGCSSVREWSRPGSQRRRLGSLYKGITIIRCLINPYPPWHCNLLRARYSDPLATFWAIATVVADCGAIRGIIRWDAICHRAHPPGLRNWNPPNPRGSATMDFQGVSDAAAAREKPIGLRRSKSRPVGLLCEGIKITRCLIGPRQESGVYR